MFGLGETAGFLGGLVVIGLFILAIYLLILAVCMPYFVYKMYQDIADIRKHTLGMSFDINSAATKINMR